MPRCFTRCWPLLRHGTLRARLGCLGPFGPRIPKSLLLGASRSNLPKGSRYRGDLSAAQSAFSQLQTDLKSNTGSGNVSVIVTATIPVGLGPEGLAATPDGAKVYVANQTGGTVSVIATATNTVTVVRDALSSFRNQVATLEGEPGKRPPKRRHRAMSCESPAMDGQIA